jgi:hemoglobin/transferrin/lactoferrin receptor protein
MGRDKTAGWSRRTGGRCGHSGSKWATWSSLPAGGLCAAAFLASVAAFAPAQEVLQHFDRSRTAASEEVAPLAVDEVTVTATKTRRDPIETPGEVNIITREEIERTQASSLKDVLKYQPGVELENGPRRIGETPVIRGLEGPRILVTVDGARLNFQSGHKGKIFLDMDSLKQVEVVRGPASALWGSGALGGVVAFTTKDPTDYLSPEATFGVSTTFGFQGVNDEFLISPAIFGRLGSGVEYLFNFTGRYGGDIRLGGNLGRLRDSAEDSEGGIGKLVWHVTPHDELKFSFVGFHDDGRAPDNPAAATTAASALVDRTTEQFTYRLGYRHRDPANPFFDFDGFVYLTTMDLTELRVSDRRRDDIDFDTVGFDLRNSMRFGDPTSHHHLLTYGIEWYRDSQQGRRAGMPNLFFPEANASTLAPYIQDEITLWDRWIIIPGLRWDRWENEAAGQPDRAESRLSPKIGTVLKVLDFLFLEANYAEGFRAPNFGELFIAGTHFPGSVFVPNPDLGPEKSRNIEAGFRIRRDRLLFERDRFLWRHAYFRNSLKDFIDFQVTFVPPRGPLQFMPINVQEALIQGYEAELEWEIYPGLTLLGNYTQIRGTNETDDQPLATIPPRKGIVGLTYLYAPWDVTVGGRVQLVDGQDRVPEGTLPTPGYTVYDVFASWTPRQVRWLQGMRFNVGIDNLTDKRYRRHLAAIPEAGINPKVSVSYTVSW